jgi:hypothetical protein
MTKQIWGEHQTTENKIGTIKIGPLTILHKAVANEVWISHSTTDTGEKEIIQDDHYNWSRWALTGDENTAIRLQPVFPDRPVIVLPEFPFRLVPGADVKIYTRIPVNVMITAAGKARRQLTEVPSVIMAKTWFGAFTEGEACFWLTTRARRAVTGEIFLPHLVVCPIHIKNNSDAELHVEKLAIRVQRMSIFNLDNKLWSDNIEIHQKGAGDHSDVHMTGKIPDEAKGAELIAAPRTPLKKSFAERTFKILHDLPGMGIKL